MSSAPRPYRLRRRPAARVNLLALESRLAPAALSMVGPYSNEQLTLIDRWGLDAWTARAAGPIAVTPDLAGPTRALPLALDDAAMRDRLLAITGPAEMALPRPDGGVERFTVWETDVMDPALAARYPGIKVYRGRGVDDPTATLAADVTYQGFHARVLNGAGSFAITPTEAVSAGSYQAYFDDDYTHPHSPGCSCPACAGAALAATNLGLAGSPPGSGFSLFTTNGTNLRTFRAAFAATGEYTALAGGTVPLGLSAISTLTNFVNVIYERDIGVHFQLVTNNDQLIYTDSSTDPYTGNNKSAMLGENQANVDSVIGSANYDVGHVLAGGNLGGVAYLGVVGNPNYKAQGVSSTGSGGPTDNYVVGVTAHELGHMHDAGHTFNGVGGTLTNNIMPASAWEVGSGSTIMSYGGNSQATPSQDYSGRNLHFHAGSIDEMVSFVNSIPGVGITTPSGNPIPTVSAGPDRAIPANTPFVLTMTANDPDGDPMTYSWEQMDLGPALSLGSPDNGLSPIFRVYPPSTSTTRYFPNLPDQLTNTYYAPETLPSTNRTMTMRAFVRDNNPGKGAINSDDVILTVVNTGTPFRVTAPNTAVSWGGNSSQIITWDVAGTTAAPINAANVNIRLSTDGGQTWPTLLATNTANDGSELLVIPNTPTTQARIKVEPTNNVFYDFSDANFTITAGSSFQVTATTPANGALVTVPLTTFDVAFSAAVKASTLGVNDLVLSTGTVTAAQLLDATTARYTLSGVTGEGVVTVTVPTGAVTDGAGNPNASYVMTFTGDIATAAFPAALLAVPPAGSLVYEGSTSGVVNVAGDADAFTLDLAGGQALSLTVVPVAGLRPSVTLTGPGGVNLTASASVPGQVALLQTAALPADGTYTLSVTGLANTTGSYTVAADLNAAVEAEWKGQATNHTTGTAQALAGSAVALGGGATRWSVLGQTDPVTGLLPVEAEPNNSVAAANDASRTFVAYSNNRFQLTANGSVGGAGDSDYFNVGAFQAGDVVTISLAGAGGQRGSITDAYVEMYRAGDPGVIVVEDDDSGPSGGSPNDSLVYRFTVGTTDTYYVRARHWSGSGTGTYALSLWLENTGAAPTTGGNTVAEAEPNDSTGQATNLSGSWRAVNYRAVTAGTVASGDPDVFSYQFTAGDRVTVATTGVSGPDTRLTLRDPAGAVIASEDGTSFPLGSESAIYAYRILTTGKFTVEVGTTGGSGGYNVEVYLSSPTAPPAPAPTADFYAVSLTGGTRATFGLKNLAAGTVSLSLTDSGGAVLAPGTPDATNLDRLIADYLPTTTGTYYLKVESGSQVPYHLVAVSGAGFDAEANDSFATAKAAPTGRVLGAVTPSNDDYFQVVAAAGQTITLATATPGGALNLLDPAVDLYDPSGALVGSDDNSGGDGRNASLTQPATTSGTYRARVRSAGGTSGDYVLSMTVSADAPPAVSGAPVVNDGSPGRSRVTQLTVAFSEVVTLGTGAFQLTRTGPGSPTGDVNVTVDTSASTPTETVAKLTFSGPLSEGTSLIDGLYMLTVVANQVTDSSSQNLAGGDYTFNLHRLFGDADGDRDVDVQDYGAFRGAFGTSAFAFDIDGDADVDAADYGAFRGRFGTSV